MSSLGLRSRLLCGGSTIGRDYSECREDADSQLNYRGYTVPGNSTAT